MNFPSVSLFSSTANADLTAFFSRMGCEASTNAYSIKGSTPLIDSLASVKYALYSEPVSNTNLMRYLRESGSTYLYENLYTLPLGFMIPSDLEENWQYMMDNPADVQNDFSSLLGADDILMETAGITEGSTFRFTADITGEYYVYVLNHRVESVNASLPTGTLSFDNVDRGYFLELGTIAEGNEVVLTSGSSGEELNAVAYRFSERSMISIYDILNRQTLTLTSWTDTHLSGTVNTDSRGTLFTSIPYDKGWTVTVDGQQVETRKIFDAFLAIDLPAGNHTIEFSYFPEGLAPGLAITGGALVILLLICLVKWLLHRRPDPEQKDAMRRWESGEHGSSRSRGRQGKHSIPGNSRPENGDDEPEPDADEDAGAHEAEQMPAASLQDTEEDWLDADLNEDWLDEDLKGDWPILDDNDNSQLDRKENHSREDDKS